MWMQIPEEIAKENEDVNPSIRNLGQEGLRRRYWYIGLVELFNILNYALVELLV